MTIIYTVFREKFGLRSVAQRALCGLKSPQFIHQKIELANRKMQVHYFKAPFL